MERLPPESLCSSVSPYELSEVRLSAGAIARRAFFTSAASGLGTLALASLLERDGRAAPRAPAPATGPLAPKPPHHRPRVRSCIFFFLAGGTSQIDLFDPKPKLNELQGKPLPESVLKGMRFAFIQKDSARVMGTPRTFARHGESGMWFSDLLPQIATLSDDLLMVRSMHTEPFNHHPATIMMNSGVPRLGRPTIGSWLTYGLGTECQDLPGYVVLEPGPGIRGGATNWASGFMPSTYAGVPFQTKGEPVKNLTNPAGLPVALQRKTLDAVRAINGRRLGPRWPEGPRAARSSSANSRAGDAEIASRIESYELAFRMQATAPEIMDVSRESASTREAYGVSGKDDVAGRFATSALLARRLVERGVRFVNIYMDGWDHHTGINDGLVKNCRAVDRPIAALIGDLKQRGLLDETLVVWGTEFGRTPLGDNRIGMSSVTGRDHQPSAFSMWMAGGGVRGGVTWGETDDLGMNVVKDPVHVNDFHATLLHLFGLDHLRLTYRFEGRDFRLTDVAGKVVHPWLA